MFDVSILEMNIAESDFFAIYCCILRNASAECASKPFIPQTVLLFRIFMDFRSLSIFLHLAQSLHFGRSSQACNLSPSALTRTIQRLEDELGITLLYRDNRTVRLTPAGEILKRFAEESEQRWLELQRNLEHDNILRGSLALYCSVTAANTFLPAILGAFRQAYPQVQIKLQTGDAAEALKKLATGQAEITIAALPDHLPPSVAFIQLGKTPLVFIESMVSQDVPGGKDGTIDWRTTPLIVPDQGLSRVRLDRWFRRHNLSMNIYAQVAGNEALLTMVSLGFGVGVIPQLVLEKSPLKDRVRVVPEAPVLAPFIIGACTLKKHLNIPVIAAFWGSVAR